MANPLQNFSVFLTSVRDELKQVNWPAREELVGSVVVVFTGILILGAYIGAVDWLLSNAARVILQ
jgi:preprotein translocase SecE subunit